MPPPKADLHTSLATADEAFRNENLFAAASRLHRSFRPRRAAAGVGSIRWNALLHIAISAWIEAGSSPKTVQALAEQSSIEMPTDRYGHPFPGETHKNAFDAIAASLLNLTGHERCTASAGLKLALAKGL